MKRNRCDRCGSDDIAVNNNSDSINRRTLRCRECGKTGFEVF